MAKSLKNVELKAGSVLSGRNHKWTVGRQIGNGGFANIYETSSATLPGIYALKVEDINSGGLFCEFHALMRLRNEKTINAYMRQHSMMHIGIPELIDLVVGNNLRVLIFQKMDVLPKVVDSAQAYAIAVEIIEVLRYMHENCYTHGDIKPSNIMLLGGRVYLIDYGLAAKMTGKEYKIDPKSKHDGTVEYASCDAHAGARLAPRSDLENLGYCLLEMVCGLPWAGVYNEKKNKKERFASCEAIFAQKKEFMKSLPIEPLPLQNYMQYVASLVYDSIPDYDLCKLILSES